MQEIMDQVQEMKDVTLERLEIEGEAYYKISNSGSMRPFFMSIVSDTNHWMFISSNGGLTAGRKNAQYPLFPYYTDDKVTESSETTGSKTIVKVKRGGENFIWEPFSIRYQDRFDITRNLYKNVYGNKVLFEEVNHDLELVFRYEWCSSNLYGFVRKSSIRNSSDLDVSLEIVDGIQNIMPCGVPSETQNSTSNLVDAYKRSELHKATGLGIFALSAVIVDRAEPSEALKANVVWSNGVDNARYLVSSLQLNDFRRGAEISEEDDVKGEKGAYFIHTEMELSGKGSHDWMMVAEVNQTHSKIAKLLQFLQRDDNISQLVFDDVEKGTNELFKLNASSDALQCTADSRRDARHFSNTLFNIMRGGIFDDNYKIELKDFLKYLKNANKDVYSKSIETISTLGEEFSLQDLNAKVSQLDDLDLQRLCIEYLPLKFSRRHGDPSRPWNVFSINMIDEVDGSKILDYEGNWRDIFQNWEALVHSFPDFIEGMIFRFLNASTFDGYNPYRITKGGFDWESIEPDDPWSYIGYWGDHQIIYLLKFLEFIEDHNPGKLAEFFDRDLFVYANVPYKIKSYEDILKNPKDTIEFDEESDHIIRNSQVEFGADGALLKDENGEIHRVNFIEKILATVLAKITNFVPEGGIWMNTQRPEWNDANNALVGNGISMVTLYYLRRFLNFFQTILENAEQTEVSVSNELMDYYKSVRKVFENHTHLVKPDVSNAERKSMLDALGHAASGYREHIYNQSFWGKKRTISISGLKGFVSNMLAQLDKTIEANKRSDNLYHAYNLLTIGEAGYSVEYLSEMLEGQVAVLSSGYLSSEEVLSVLDGLKESQLFRDDQYSYILYPNKDLPGFLERNNIPSDLVAKSDLMGLMISDKDGRIVEKDVFGDVHFNGNFRNVDDLYNALNGLDTSSYASLAQKERSLLGDIFESVFNHKEFTGRSGTFYGYEGLGSIYWHMVSKLLLAVQECSLNAVLEDADPSVVGRMLEHFYEINEGIGVHKSPALYGAFPTDPYSHTPAYKGAQQPGMTGQVKEDILSRYGELGVFVTKGRLKFYPCLLRKNEFLEESKEFSFIDVDSEWNKMELKAGSLAFTYCQVPVIYKMSNEEKIVLYYKDGASESLNSNTLTVEQSTDIFTRGGNVVKIEVDVRTEILK